MQVDLLLLLNPSFQNINKINLNIKNMLFNPLSFLSTSVSSDHLILFSAFTFPLLPHLSRNNDDNLFPFNKVYMGFFFSLMILSSSLPFLVVMKNYLNPKNFNSLSKQSLSSLILKSDSNIKVDCSQPCNGDNRELDKDKNDLIVNLSKNSSVLSHSQSINKYMYLLNIIIIFIIITFFFFSKKELLFQL
jgi:hypothetical protein